jgi:hypothetical protein
MLHKLVQDILLHAEMLVETALEQDSVASMGKLCNDIAKYYRALGICSLLQNAESDDFFHGLIQAALVRKYYLHRCVEEKHLTDPARRTSFVDPFLDGVAANQIKLARQISSLSPNQWWEGYEYEDDFTYAHFLHRLIDFKDSDDAELKATLEQYEKALEGGADTRFDLCKALFSKDQDQFDESFALLLDKHEEHFNKIADQSSDSVHAIDYTFEPNRWIYVEGLAILRIADTIGLQTQEEYKFCPSMARMPEYRAFVPDSFPYIGLDV